MRQSGASDTANMIVDDADDINIHDEYPYGHTTRQTWDCYNMISAHVWCGYDDDGNAVVEPYDDSLSHSKSTYYSVRVSPSQAIYAIHTANHHAPTPSECRAAFKQYVINNIDWYNTTKINHADDPLDCPPDIDIYGRR